MHTIFIIAIRTMSHLHGSNMHLPIQDGNYLIASLTSIVKVSQTNVSVFLFEKQEK